MKPMRWQTTALTILAFGWPAAQAQAGITVYGLGSPIAGKPAQLLAGSGSPPPVSDPGFDAIAELPPDSGVTPPDPNIAVSPVIASTGQQYLVESVNKGLRAFRTDGSAASGYTPFAHPVDGFFCKSGSSIFDPRLIFDPYMQRFVLIALERDKAANKGYIHIAVSASADPRGAWSVFKTSVPSSYHPDYPSLAVDHQAIYVGVNLFAGEPSGWSPPDALLYRAIAKQSIFDTNQIETMVDVVETTTSPQYHWAMRAAQPYGLPLSAPAVGLFIGTFRERNDQAPLTIFTKLRAVKMRNPLDARKVTLTGFDVPVPAYSEPSQDGPQKCATAGQELDVSSGQLQNAVWRKGDLYAAHTVPAAGVNTVRWYQIRTGPPDAPVTWSQLVQDGDVHGNLSGQHTYLPTVGVDAHGSLVIAYAQSSTADPVSFRIAARAACDDHGTTQYRSIVKEVDLCYQDSTQAKKPYRWGDYWGVAVDPASPPLLWAVGESVKAGTQWGTWIVPIVITSECPACACSR